MFGGYNKLGNAQFIRRTFTFAPKHNKLRITGKVHILDSWEF